MLGGGDRQDDTGAKSLCRLHELKATFYMFLRPLPSLSFPESTLPFFLPSSNNSSPLLPVIGNDLETL